MSPECAEFKHTHEGDDTAEYNRNQYIFLLRCFMWKVMFVLDPEDIKSPQCAWNTSVQKLVSYFQLFGKTDEIRI